jgi:putative ABC transport system permease protein
VLKGRAIDPHDAAGSASVVVVNRALVDQFFPNGDAVGRRLKLVNPAQSDQWRTIVGVVGDIKYQGLDEETPATIYTPFAQTPMQWLYMMIRTPVASPSLMRSLRETVPAVNPTLTAASVRPMNGVIAQSVATPRFNMLLVSSFAVLALILAAIGIYGVIGYSVAQRTHEIGVRMALGARGADVMRLVLGEGLGMAVGGLLLGLAGAAALSRVMAGMLFGVTGRDPLTFVAGAALLLLVAMLASYLPARRAMRIEPSSSLRME